MNTYDLISFDMDGTLLNSHKTISKTTMNAIQRALSADKIVILSTGRCLSELEDYRDILKELRYYICESGALIYDSHKEQIIDSDFIPHELVLEIMDIARTEDVMVYIASNGHHRCNHSDVLQLEHFGLGHYKDMMLKTAILHQDIIEDYIAEPFSVEKLNLFCVSGKQREVLYQRLSNLPLTMAYFEETSLEISPLSVSKASGLKKLCSYLSIPLDRTIAVGDSDNDAEILRTAGLSVAMDNALPHIKELCDVTVADNDHDGCAEAIDRFLLNS